MKRWLSLMALYWKLDNLFLIVTERTDPNQGARFKMHGALLETTS
jgi:hypothetical protein